MKLRKETQMLKLKQGSVWLDDNVLLCPGCSGNNLHHSTVTVFTRSQEDAKPVRTIIGNAEVITGAMLPTGENPSSRRDGIAIGFWCENCSFQGELTIAQHKGLTLVEWRE